MSTAVANASPLIALSNVHLHGLLKEVFAEVIVPDAVWREVVLEGAGRPGARECRQAARQGWLLRRSPTDKALVAQLLRSVGPGESEAIALALETAADWALLDDPKARAEARRLGVEPKGTLGVLVVAQRVGLIADVPRVLDDLRATGFRMSDWMYRETLAAAGEARGDSRVVRPDTQPGG
jgi:predicted nucleic acid-binding protein